ncbi:ABC transporter substrate-binding protein [Aquamicrobium sp. LC103]|uniref:ABC transporter substrate-binding protein n=1 Tax=Aquamicrobium sp. LC103 TaxID=1120658 RepID=UPI001FEE7AF7|nr:ABC transporter substrate-binding protein [Aquamicrobium sp. LC103]
MNYSVKSFLCAGLGGVAMALASSVAPAQEAEPIKIGFATALSGWLAAYDQEPHQAAILKIEEINKAGGLLGRKIEYQVTDTKTDLTLTANVAASLIDWGANMLVVPPDFDYGAPAAFMAQNANLIAISTGASDPKMGVQGVGSNVFSAHSAGQAAGIVMAEYAHDKMNAKTAFMLEDVSLEAHKSSCAGFVAGWENKGGELVGRDSFRMEDTSIAAQITRIKGLASEPDIIFLCSGLPQGASAVRQVRAAGIDTPILAEAGMSGDYWLGGVPNLKDFYVPTLMSISDDPRPEVNKFIEAYKARWGALPTTEFSILGYCTIEQWAAAVEQAQSVETEVVLAVMNQFEDQPTTCGPTSYSDQIHIQVSRPQLIARVENGSFRSVEIFRNQFVPDLKLLLRSSN